MSSRSIRANNLSSPNYVLSKQKTANIHGVGFSTVDLSDKVWKRNPAWLDNVSITNTDQAAGILVAIDDSTTNPIKIGNITGNYEVDWGDGNGFQQYSSGSNNTYNYDWSDSTWDGTNGAVTFTDSTDLVTVDSASGFAFENGDIVNFYSVTTTTGISANRNYYVINVNSGARTFQLSLTSGGSAISLTNDGSGTLLPYKQALVHVRAQSGANITYAKITDRPEPETPANGYTCSPYLEIVASFPNCTGDSTFTFTGTTWGHSRLEHIHLVNCQDPNWSLRFYQMSGLKYVRLDTLGAISTLASCWYGCSALLKIQIGEIYDPTIELPTSTCTTFTQAFSECSNLIAIPRLQFDSATGVISIFYNCRSIQELQPKLWGNTVTALSSAFSGCHNLKRIPTFGFKSTVTNLSSLFSRCYSLKQAPMLDTSNITSFSTVFSNCYALTTLPNWDVSSATNISYMFENCYALKEIPDSWQFSSLLSMNQAFYNCNNLIKIPLGFDNIQPTSLNQCFYNCYSLFSLPEWDTSNCTSFYGAYWGCSNASNERIELDCSSIGANANHFQYVFYGCQSLNEVNIKNSANLQYVQNSFQNCYFINKITFDQPMTWLNAGSTFNGCRTLTYIVADITLSGTSFSSMFVQCFSLIKLPKLDASGVNSAQSQFIRLCYSIKNASEFTGMRYGTLEFTTSAMNATALNTLYTNLGTASGQTIIVTGNPGTSEDDPTIATAKGWTVTG